MLYRIAVRTKDGHVATSEWTPDSESVQELYTRTLGQLEGGGPDGNKKFLQVGEGAAVLAETVTQIEMQQMDDAPVDDDIDYDP